MTRRPVWLRAVRFQFVGLVGIGVQLAMLYLLKEHAQLGTKTATLLAVETAIVHNFVWHEKWTWAPDAGGPWGRFVRFQLGTGLVTLLNNLVLMVVLVDVVHLHYLLANLMAIAAGAVLNFLLADRWVFRGPDQQG